MTNCDAEKAGDLLFPTINSTRCGEKPLPVLNI